MTVDGFLTFLTLLIAVYALAPPVSRLRARLAFLIQIPLALITLLLVIYLLFFDVVGQPCISFFGICDWISISPDGSIAPSDIAFFILIFWMGIAYVVHKYLPRRVPSFSIVKLVKLVDMLEYEKKYSELLEFVEPYLPLIGRAATRSLTLQKYHDKLVLMQGGMKAIIHGIWNKEEGKRESQRGRFTKNIRRWIGTLAIVLPKNQKAENAAEDIIRVLFQSEALRVYIAKNRPYFVIPLTQQEMFGGRQFFKEYLELLIADTGSVSTRKSNTIKTVHSNMVMNSLRVIVFYTSYLLMRKRRNNWRFGNQLGNISCNY